MKNTFWFIYCLTCYFNYLKKWNERRHFLSRKKKICQIDSLLQKRALFHHTQSRFSFLFQSNKKLLVGCDKPANTPTRLIIAWWLWISLVKIKAAWFLRQSTCMPLRPIRIQEINSRMISLATLGHVLQIAKRASHNYFRLHRNLSCFQKETRPPEKNIYIFIFFF